MVVVIDPQIAGVSGDMLLCSFVDLGADKNKIIDKIKQCRKIFTQVHLYKKLIFKRHSKTWNSGYTINFRN